MYFEKTARARERGLGRKGQCCEHCPRCNRSVVWTVGHTARHVAEEAAVTTVLAHFRGGRAVSRRYTPEIATIGFKAVWIAFAVFAMDSDGVFRILEIVAGLLT